MTRPQKTGKVEKYKKELQEKIRRQELEKERAYWEEEDTVMAGGASNKLHEDGSVIRVGNEESALGTVGEGPLSDYNDT